MHCQEVPNIIPTVLLLFLSPPGLKSHLSYFIPGEWQKSTQGLQLAPARIVLRELKILLIVGSWI